MEDDSTMGDIRKMLNPATIALIGATEREGSIGRRILDNLLVSGDRKVLPVNPGRKTVLGMECATSVSDVDGDIDLAVVAVRAAGVPQVVDECGRRGVHGAIVVSSGFREAGENGKMLEKELLKAKERYGIRIVGPNCLGIMIPAANLNATFLKIRPESGNIAFLSQSGALGDAIMGWGTSNHVGFSMFASLGSMVDVDFADLIDYLSYDYATQSIMLYMERVGTAKRFMSAARGFARTKPIVVLKPGRFGGSARAVESHTGGVVGDDRVYGAAFKRAGIVRIKEIADLFDTSRVLVSRTMPKGARLAIVTNAGGVGIIATDTLIELEGHVAELSGQSIGRLDGILPGDWSKGNPVDIVGDADLSRYTGAIEICMSDEGVDGVLVVYTPRAEVEPLDLAQALRDLSRRSNKPLIVVWMAGIVAEKGRDLLIENNIPVYRTPEEAVKAYLYMHQYRKNIEMLYEIPEDISPGHSRSNNHQKAIIRNCLRKGTGSLTMEQSVSLMKTYDIPFPPTSFPRGVDEAVRMAEAMGFPVTLKVAAGERPGPGGLFPGIASRQTLLVVLGGILAGSGREPQPTEMPEMMVQKTVRGKTAGWFLNTRRDIDFGSTIFLLDAREDGLPGDRSVAALPPLNQTLAKIFLEEAGVQEALRKEDGKEVQSLLRQFEALCVNFACLIVDFPEILAIEAGPIVVDDGGVYMTDAVIDLDGGFSSQPARYYSHLVITPYPTQYVTPWTLRDGTDVVIRPIRPEDEPLSREMLARTSEEALRVRFFSSVNVREIPHSTLMRFCNVDYDREVALVAEVREAAEKRIVGGGRLIIEPDLKRAQFAVLVHDSLHGKGLGEKFLDMLIGIAQERGLEAIYGIVLTENDKMLRLCKKMGFLSKRLPDGITQVEMKLN
jgi:acetyltransferase